MKKTFASLRIRNYLIYFIGQSISQIGTWMQTIAQDWLVLQLTHSGTQLGLVTAVQFLPTLLLSPWAGIIADRFNKRTILYITQVIAGILAFVLGFLVLTHDVQLWMVYLLALGLGITNTLTMPAQQPFVPELVDKEHLSNAITLNAIMVNIARAVGPALAGSIIATAGIGVCFISNGISYIAVIIALALMRQSEIKLTARAASGGGKLKEGWRYVVSSPILLNTLIMMAIIGTLSYEFSVSMPLLAQITFHGTAATYSALITATGVGSIVGGLITAGRRNVTFGRLVAAAFGFGVTLGLAAVMPNVVLAIFVLFFAGVFSVVFISSGSSLLQIESKPELRGRVMALWSMAFLGSTPIGGPIIGWIGDTAGPRWGLLVGGIAAIVAGGIGFFAYRRQQNLRHQGS
jgi:MFS family permease